MKTKKTTRANGTTRIQIHSDLPSKVEQTHKKEVNINTIVAKAHRTGLFPIRQEIPTYGDFSSTIDFHEAKNRIAIAQSDFMTLPSDLRRRFENDAGKLLDFLGDPDNLEESIKLGLRPQTDAPGNGSQAVPQEPEKAPESEAGSPANGELGQ